MTKKTARIGHTCNVGEIEDFVQKNVCQRIKHNFLLCLLPPLLSLHLGGRDQVRGSHSHKLRWIFPLVLKRYPGIYILRVHTIPKPSDILGSDFVNHKSRNGSSHGSLPRHPQLHGTSLPVTARGCAAICQHSNQVPQAYHGGLRVEFEQNQTALRTVRRDPANFLGVVENVVLL